MGLRNRTSNPQRTTCGDFGLEALFDNSTDHGAVGAITGIRVRYRDNENQLNLGKTIMTNFKKYFVSKFWQSFGSFLPDMLFHT